MITHRGDQPDSAAQAGQPTGIPGVHIFRRPPPNFGNSDSSSSNNAAAADFKKSAADVEVRNLEGQFEDIVIHPPPDAALRKHWDRSAGSCFPRAWCAH